VNPYNNEHPNNNNPEEKAPRIKYFKPASVENSDSRFNDAIIYIQKLCNSIARYMAIKS
jgi:hypothetical protein